MSSFCPFKPPFEQQNRKDDAHRPGGFAPMCWAASTPALPAGPPFRPSGVRSDRNPVSDKESLGVGAASVGIGRRHWTGEASP